MEESSQGTGTSPLSSQPKRFFHALTRTLGSLFLSATLLDLASRAASRGLPVDPLSVRPGGDKACALEAPSQARRALAALLPSLQSAAVAPWSNRLLA